MQTGGPMFPEEFHAFKYGPVIPSIRLLYKQNALNQMPNKEIVALYKPVFDEVFKEYAQSKPFTLVAISHAELSWQRAHIGYSKYQSSDVPMKLNDIMEDTERYKKRCQILSVQQDYLISKGIHNHEEFVRTIARSQVPVVRASVI
ncbi:MAG: DUF4065 domain-containing protein [Bacteroidales bacterium]|nr:DUF4065 domain-containing protein [Bacteroidales bacterium]